MAASNGSGQGINGLTNERVGPCEVGMRKIKIIRRDLGHLPVDIQTKVLSTNVSRLYSLDITKIPTGISSAAAAAQAAAL